MLRVESGQVFIIDIIFSAQKNWTMPLYLAINRTINSHIKYGCGLIRIKEGSSDKEAVGSNTLIYVVHFRVQLEDSLSVQAVSYELAMVIICGLYPSPMTKTLERQRQCELVFLLHKAFTYL
jgi:hypothetical protein